MKVVPMPEEVRVNEETMTLDRANARSFINPPDMNALELALQLRERHGGVVTVLSMGPPFFERYLRLTLCAGADRVVLLSDRAFGGADTLGTSRTLAAGIEKIGGFDLVLCGEESSDGATAQVPPGIAEWLDLPQVTYALSVDIDLPNRRLSARREVKGGHERLLAPLPAVVSVKQGINEPRFIDWSLKPWADSVDRVTVWSAQDLEVPLEEVGTAGSATVVAGVSQSPTRERRRERLTGDPARIARELAERLRPFLFGPERGP
ncbi:MAG TPA: electron transfer flavoprotein subunit beta/FixA family protein [Dehalococcoidia bacterium]|nr:electron transfer flavoprotein subunit beta/FixA family protein [Dehalococcoidia bacterium]